MDPVTARRTWRTLEPIHGMVYFADETASAYRDAGLDDPGDAYFPVRAAAMGAVGADVVIATFYNFHPAAVRRALPSAWDRTTPAALLAARESVADRALRRLLGAGIETPEIVEASELARTAAMSACELPEGRPLFAGHAGQPWPDEPHLVLWHAQTLLREFRGDGHVAALVMEGLSGIEALITHAASGDVPGDVLRRSRRWTEQEWADARHGLVLKGWLTENGDFTDVGRAGRERIERRTDELAVRPYEVLGEERCRRLRSLVRASSQVIVAASGLGRATVPDSRSSDS